MRNATLKATGLGSKTFEQDEHVALSPRQRIFFDCPHEHQFSVVFSDEAELPTAWECPSCGASALRADGVRETSKDVKPLRSHWDRIRERRTMEELEDVFNERLALLKAGVIGPNAYEKVAIDAKRKVR